ncbi:hypothetical protein BJ138DRAFT_1119312 [Hygrophoropsis aurantiaca]|uniref:Uncharacterized protein n=1 Tax=Hygrophoropsis aurantiaca TaxID=72124 RepID=A0ACB7ZV60_9AGAM|nr:hypothetical protein BJ138DRAFT_1119312 [Hygrophoropsis aurantiaca]
MSQITEDRSSLQSYGRTFSTEDTNYSLPNDSAEHERLKLQHDAFKLLLGGNFLVPVHQEGSFRPILLTLVACLIDSPYTTKSQPNCETFWTFATAAMAREFPGAVVVGVDIAEPQSLRDVPPNVKFLKHNINSPLPFPDHYFDFVQMRIVPSLPDRKAIMQEISRILRPGGFVAFLEPAESFSGKTNTRTPALVEVDRLMVQSPHTPRARVGETNTTKPKSWSIAWDIAPMLRDATDSEGNLLFRTIQVKEVRVPVGTWPKDAVQKQIGEIIARVQMGLIDAFKPTFLTLKLLTGSEFDSLREAAQAEVEDGDLEIQSPIVYAWGRKS